MGQRHETEEGGGFKAWKARDPPLLALKMREGVRIKEPGGLQMLEQS